LLKNIVVHISHGAHICMYPPAVRYYPQA
jgi:hypothetical protein